MTHQKVHFWCRNPMDQGKVPQVHAVKELMKEGQNPRISLDVAKSEHLEQISNMPAG